MFEKCEGVVIRTADYGETNKVVTLYTREWGKVGVMARGAKKPNSRLAAITQPFTYGNFLVQRGRGLGTLQQGEMISSMRGIREDIFLTAYASYVIDLADKSTDEKKPDPYLFELLLQTIQYLDEGYDPEVLVHIFEMKILRVLGLRPILDHCANCGATEGNFVFSIREGGLLCHRCLEIDPYHLKAGQPSIKLLRLFYLLDLSRLGSISVKEETKADIKKIIQAYYDEYSGLHLKTKRFLDQLDNLKGKL